jgi:hypothetical protein
MRLVVMFVVVAAIVGFGWVFSLPSKSECIASGRIVDPTERHCESAAGYEQLQEHGLFHSRETVLGAAIVLATGYAIQRYRRRRPSNVAPTA